MISCKRNMNFFEFGGKNVGNPLFSHGKGVAELLLI